MRRKDREIIDANKIDEIIKNCHCCRLGFVDNGKPYIVPLNFGFTHENGKRTFYFHGAKEGRKIDLIKTTGFACFEMDTQYSLTTGKEACDYTCAFQCVMGEGKITLLEETEEKRFALNQIMHKETGKTNWHFPSIMLNRTATFKLEIETISCKEHE